MSRSFVVRSLVLRLAVAFLVPLLGATTISLRAAGQESSAGARPVLLAAAAAAFTPRITTVSGDGFTPGGEVYIALYDQWGSKLHETRLTAASGTMFGPNGSVDPSLGYHAGGRLTESFGGLCGATAMVRAFDRGSATWSNWLDVDSTAARLAHYGENGSQDPARGFQSGCVPEN